MLMTDLVIERSRISSRWDSSLQGFRTVSSKLEHGGLGSYRKFGHAIWFPLACCLACGAIKGGNEMGMYVDSAFKWHLKSFGVSLYYV